MNSVVKQIGDKRVFFGYDDFSITEVSADALLDVMEVVQDNPDAKVTLTSHTDNRGSFFDVQNIKKRQLKKWIVNN